MLPTLVSILVVAGLSLYVIGIFVYDYRRRKSGKPSIFLDQCESEGKGKRLIREFHKAYKKGK